MCHVLPTTLLCAALDHSFHSFSLSLCPNHNKVYIHISNQTWYALFSAFFGSYCWNICVTFTLLNAYQSVWVVFQVACLLSPVSCLCGNIYLSVSVYIVNVILYFKYKFGLLLYYGLLTHLKNVRHKNKRKPTLSIFLDHKYL